MIRRSHPEVNTVIRDVGTCVAAWTTLPGFNGIVSTIIAGLGDPHGLAIKDELEEYYQKEVQHGRLYPTLDTLVEKGLVEKSKQDGRTNAYTVTTKGRKAIQNRREWEDSYLESLLSA